MLDKFKQMKEMRDMQKQMQEEKAEGESNGVRIVLNGTFSIEELSLNPDLETSQQEAAIRQAFSQAMQRLQKSLAQKFGGMM